MKKKPQVSTIHSAVIHVKKSDENRAKERRNSGMGERKSLTCSVA